MAYEVGHQRLVARGPAIRAADALAERSDMRFRAWRRLAPERRLEAVEQALEAPANDLIDAFPIAL